MQRIVPPLYLLVEKQKQWEATVEERKARDEVGLCRFNQVDP
jgi:hypothetical protein